VGAETLRTYKVKPVREAATQQDGYRLWEQFKSKLCRTHGGDVDQSIRKRVIASEGVATNRGSDENRFNES
jgi:hypothetical protein